MLSLIQIFFAVFGVMDPVGNIPFFLTFAEPLDKAGKNRFAKSAVLYAGGIALFLIGVKILFSIEFGAKKESTRVLIGGSVGRCSNHIRKRNGGAVSSVS